MPHVELGRNNASNHDYGGKWVGLVAQIQNIASRQLDSALAAIAIVVLVAADAADDDVFSRALHGT